MISARFRLINLLVDWSCRDWTPTPFTDRRCEMSPVDYTIAVRRRRSGVECACSRPVAGVGGDDRRPVNGHCPTVVYLR